MKIDLVKLASEPPRDSSTFPPWIAVPTAAAGGLISTHPQQMKKWIREGVGPLPAPKGTISKAHMWPPHSEQSTGFWFQIGRVIEFWEKMVLPADQARSFQTICRDWRATPLADQVLNLFPHLESEEAETCPTEASILRHRIWLAVCPGRLSDEAGIVNWTWPATVG